MFPFCTPVGCVAHCLGLHAPRLRRPLSQASRPAQGEDPHSELLKAGKKGKGTKIALCNEHRAHVLHDSGYSRDERSTTTETRTSLTALLGARYPQMLSTPFSANPDSRKLFSKSCSRKKLCRPREDDFPGSGFTKRNVWGKKTPFSGI